MSDSLPPSDTDGGFDPDERALCPDESCIGVLDGAGRCKACGRQGVAAAGARADVPDVAVYSEDAAAGLDAELDGESASDSAADADSDDFDDRRLCADPACIGVLDPAGRCKECGRIADALPSAP